MATHITIRMAWHDNEWSGKICDKPKQNVYCTGIHSLLSDRIQRNKKPDIEDKHHSEKLNFDEEGNYFPPCYWSCNAFSSHRYNLKIEHPFENVKAKPIKDTLKPYSVYTWPFRLSFNHSREKFLREGKYPPDLDKRIETFFGKFKPKESVIFFYANYDNPITADDEKNKYVLLGCSLLNGIDPGKNFDFAPGEYEKLKKGKRMKNLPKSVWARQLHHDFKNWGILLPYKAYLDRIEKYPEEEEKLEEMRAVIDEDSINSNFKYVAEELDDDKCIYLLYKIRKSLKIISEEHGFANVDREKAIIEKLIQKSWERRGLYPSLSRILDIIGEVKDGDESIGEAITSKLKEKFGADPKQLDLIFSLITNKDQETPYFLEDVSSEIETLQSNIADHLEAIDLLKKLSLFELTTYQLKRIIYQTDNPFKKPIDSVEITRNPYLLAENYVPQEQDIDNPKILDDEINVFKIDIGMFPDKRYLKKTNTSIQNLTQKSPERLRAIIVDYLKNIGESGDCYAPLDGVYNSIIKYPLFYKEELDLNKLELTSQTNRYHEHFKDRLAVIDNKEGDYFFYLREVYHGEQLIHDVVKALLKRDDYPTDTSWVKNYVEQEADKLATYIPKFDRGNFIQERTTLFTNVMRKSFYVLSGNPGSGKTYALGRIIQEMRKNNEQVTLLAPTGKAALRLKEKTNFGAQTNDMFFYSNGYGLYVEDFHQK